MKKCISMLLALAMMLSLAACGGGGGGGGASSAGSAGSSGGASQSGGGSASEPDYSKYEVTEPVTIQFWHNYSNAARTEWLETKAAEFTASQDMVTVEVVYIGGYPLIAEQIAGALAANGQGLPAISTINAPRVLNFAASEIIEPLDEYFDAMGIDRSDYLEGMLDGMSDANGDLYALPFGISAGVIMYNKSVCDQYKLPFPETWEDFKTWCREIHKATGKVAFGFPYDFNYMNTFFLNVTGIDPLGDGTVSQLDDPKIIEFVHDLKALVDEGCCSWIGAKINGAQDDQLAQFTMGELIAYTDTSSGLIKAIQAGTDAATPFEVGSAIGVTGTSAAPISTTSGASLVIYSDNDQNVKNAAFQFAAYLTNADNSTAWAVDTCMFPVHHSTIESGALNDLYAQYPGVKGTFDNSDKIIGKNKSPAMEDCMSIVVTTLGDYLKGNISEANFDSAWATMKEEVDMELADVS